MTGSVRKSVEAQVYAFFAAILVALMLLAGFFIDSADSERRRLIQTELSLVAREASHSAIPQLGEADRPVLRRILREIAVDHDLSYLAVSGARAGVLVSVGQMTGPDTNPKDVVSQTIPLEADGNHVGELTLERVLIDPSAMRSVGSHIVLTLGALIGLVAAAWAGLRFFVISRSSQESGEALPLSPLAAISSPFLRRDHADFAALRPDQVAVIVRQSGFTMVLVLSNGACLVGSLWSQVPQEFLILWATVIGSMAVFNLRVWLRNRNRPLPVSVSKQTLRRMTYQAGLLGLSWGIALSVFFTGADTLGRFVLIALGLGMAAGGTATLASVPSAALAYTGSILVPAALRFATLDGDGFAILAILCIIYAGSMGAFLGQAYHSFARNVLARQAQARQAETIALVLNTYEEQASDWLWETDTQQRLHSPPERMELLFGGRGDGLAGCRFQDLVTGGEDSGWTELLEALSKQDRFRDLIVRTQDVGGRDRWISLSGRKRDDGRWHGVGSDVTIREAALVQLREAMEEAKSASRATTAFLAATSHELRTPLNAIIGFSELLAATQVSAEKAEDYAQTINGAGIHLLNIVNGILEMAQIEAGHKRLRYETVDVGAAVGEAIVFLSLQAEEAGITLHCRTCETSIQLDADRQALRQILLNIMGNAIKFTMPGGSVDIEAISQEDQVLLVVEDSGIGIAKVDIDRILQPFTQVDDGLERRYDGTGLGLPIAKSLIELHGGSLSITSSSGQGTSVRICFPRPLEAPLKIARSG
ncbi:HAMP domain-containing sensor histidine kinase [Pelagibius sp. Alg239-R121]|uniref:sensor histidine kinase n=1 Tax=Pelagibius sp. Alg239-R121 TaxID=2993448 RepID=UPI0024A72E9B|nr:HAMP domain-containing sensor histidine kinase [Pelagibius sp. Alg239-R121]